MKYGKLSAERRRVYTLEAAEIGHDLVRETGNGAYTLSEYAARKALLENGVFQWDCAGFGFPDEVNILESDTPDTFDVEIYWRD